MNTENQVILTREEFTSLHNARSELYFINQELSGILNETLSARFKAALDKMQSAMAATYSADDALEKERGTYYKGVQIRQGLKTEWSNFTIPVDGLRQVFQEGTTKVYFQSEDPIILQDPSWLMMWRAADQLWKQSGEQFRNELVSFVPHNDGWLAVFEG